MIGCMSAMLVCVEQNFFLTLVANLGESNYMEGWFVRASNRKKNKFALKG